nr:cell surface glycoprotein CD200 receptor 1-A-like [Nerophis lumbriciformis]
MKEPVRGLAVILSLLCQVWTWDSVVDLSFNVGSEVELNCNHTEDLVYVIWKIKLEGGKQCQVGINLSNGKKDDTCGDSTSLEKASEAHYYLRIPEFTERDVGLYKSEMVFNGGMHTCSITLSITVPPRISSWLEWSDDGTLAICKAEGGKPAANITWRHVGNSSSAETRRASGYVESRQKLHENNGDVMCVVKHPFWSEEKILIPVHKKGVSNVVWILLVISVLVMLAAFLLVIYKKQTILRRCLLSNRSPSKSEQTEAVEEVEPYECYVQRVNSIYNL